MQETAVNVDWRLDAKCRDVDPNMFFPVGTKKEVLAANKEAVAFCAGCAVIDECLEYALANKLKGVQGGTTEGERKKILKARRQNPDI